MADDLAADTQIVLCTAPGMMYPVEDVLSAAVCTTYVLSAPSVYVLCAACELSVCAGTILFKPLVLSIQNTMVRTYVHLLSGWMCALCFMYAYVLFVHYMVRSMLLSILYVCMYVHSMLSVCTRGVYVLCMQYVLYSIIMYVLSEYAL